MKKADVINYFGGICKTADALGIKHPSVSGWDDVIPKGRAYEIEKITKGKL
ncbi:Cro/CI family transcriptional regulator, partial [Morganella morganii]|uniref:Cro/CI family transcriptional regulator n=2 Tax=Morganellaceae TaxID=1903414 RepID=UPI002FD96E3A